MSFAADTNVKVVYEQNDVFVHTAVTNSTFNDNIIRGKLCIIESGLNVTVDWQPSSELTPDLEYEVHTLFSGPIEYGVVTPSITSPDINEKEHSSKKDENCQYRVSFDVQEIQYVRRSDTKLAWSYLVFILKDGSTQPALHFHDGGINDLISRLQRYIWLTRSPTTKNLYIRQERDAAMESTLNQLELFTENASDSFSKFINDTYFGTLSGFSKVTHFVLKGIGQSDMQETRPRRESGSEVNDQEYEILHSYSSNLLEPDNSNPRENPLQPEEWCSFMNDEGEILNVKELKERIFRGGIHPDIRREAWKFLLGYFAYSSTYEERTQHKLESKNRYHIMKMQWSTISPEQEAKFSDFAQRKHIVDKDAIRTDRTMEYYKGDDNENVKKLNDILMTYCMYNFDLGYVQGMSDLLSPILLIMEDEIDAFWCFVGFMKMEERTFEMNQQLMKQQLENLGKLVQYLFPEFWEFLVKKEAQNLFCCFRWILISFKRDFGLGDTLILWEVLWTQTLTPHFKLFICLAILEREKDIMMKEDYDFNEILKHINLLAGAIDLQQVLSRAEYIVLNLKRRNHLPEEIAQLVLSTDKENVSTVNNIDTMNIESLEAEDIVGERTSPHETENVSSMNDAVVELKENSESIF